MVKPNKQRSVYLTDKYKMSKAQEEASKDAVKVEETEELKKAVAKELKVKDKPLKDILKDDKVENDKV